MAGNAQSPGQLGGKVVLVTGASEGIGLGIAQRAAQEGAQVILTGRRAAALEAAAERIGRAAIPVVGDVAELSAQSAAIDAALGLGRLDVIVNNAAYVPEMNDLLDLSDDVLDQVWRVNVLAPLQLVRLAHRRWMGEKGGTVVNIGSLGGVALQPGMGAYSMAKAALHHQTRFLAAELAPQVRVNAIAPGPVRTPGADPVWDALGDRAAARIPLQRLGLVDDVASAALFLMTDASSWITGETLVLDGGTSVQTGKSQRRSR